MLSPVACAGPEGHKWVSGSDIARGHFDVWSSCYYQSPHRVCGLAAAWSHINVGRCGRAGPAPPRPPQSSSQLLASGVGWDRLILPGELATRNLTILQWVNGQHEWTCFSFWGRGAGVTGEWGTQGKTGGEHNWGAWGEILKQLKINCNKSIE